MEIQKLREIELFATTRVRERASEIDEKSTYPGDLVEDMKKLGLFSMYIPERYGGEGASLGSLMEAVRIISRECASTSLIVDVTVSLFGEPVLKHGSEFLKHKYLSRIAKGSIGALAITEPGTGSDAAAIKTTSKRKGDSFVINGSKTFITNGNEAEFYIVSAITSPEKKHKGITLFVVDRDMDGVSVGKEFKKMGIRGTSTTEIMMNDVTIEKDHILGQEDSGFSVEMETLNVGRIGIASQAIGIAEGTVRDVLNFNKNAEEIPRENFQFKLADMANLLRDSIRKYEDAIEHSESDKPSPISSSFSKLSAGDSAVKITGDAVQLLGYYALTEEYPVERRFREAKITQIYEGTNEIQRLIIARELIKAGDFGAI